MRKKARKILFEELEKSGWQWAIFNEDEPNKTSGLIECVLDAMEKFKKVKKSNSYSGKINSNKNKGNVK